MSRICPSCGHRTDRPRCPYDDAPTLWAPDQDALPSASHNEEDDRPEEDGLIPLGDIDGPAPSPRPSVTFAADAARITEVPEQSELRGRKGPEALGLDVIPEHMREDDASSAPPRSSGVLVAVIAAVALVVAAVVGALVFMGGAPAGMVAFEAAEFRMGCAKERAERCDPDESPQRAVRLGAFAVDQHEVTVGDYAAFLRQNGPECGAGPCVAGGGQVDGAPAEGAQRLPMTGVTWRGAAQYCAARGARLCAEAEWEWAARGAGDNVFPWGADEPSCDSVAASLTGCHLDGPLPVGSRPAGATAVGLQDMAGNVWEWVADCHRGSYATARPRCPADGKLASAAVDSECDGSRRVRRGGSFRSYSATFLRATNRDAASMDRGYGDTGFRCCQSL